MKRKFLVILVLLSVSFSIHAQETTEQKPIEVEKLKIKIDEDTEKMSQGYNRCLKVFIPEATQRDVERNFSKFIKDYNAKADEKKGEYFFDNAQIKQFGNNPVDVYSIALQEDKGVTLMVFFDLGGAFMDSKDHKDEFEVAERMLYDFARKETSRAIENQVGTAQKELQSKIREHDELVRMDSMYHRKIRECQQIIMDSETGIKTVEEQQAAKQKEIEEHQKMMEGLKAKQAGIE